MSLSGWIMMTLVLAGIWGGFVYLRYQSSRPDQE